MPGMLTMSMRMLDEQHCLSCRVVTTWRRSLVPTHVARTALAPKFQRASGREQARGEQHRGLDNRVGSCIFPMHAVLGI